VRSDGVESCQSAQRSEYVRVRLNSGPTDRPVRRNAIGDRWPASAARDETSPTGSASVGPDDEKGPLPHLSMEPNPQNEISGQIRECG